jgi:hypothetical protein
MAAISRLPLLAVSGPQSLRQMHEESRAAAKGAFDAYTAAMGLGNTFDNRQTQTASGRWRGARFSPSEKLLKDVWQAIRWYAQPRICDSQLDPIACGTEAAVHLTTRPVVLDSVVD